MGAEGWTEYHLSFLPACDSGIIAGECGDFQYSMITNCSLNAQCRHSNSMLETITQTGDYTKATANQSGVLLQCQGQARGFGVWRGQSGWKNHPWAPGGQSPQEVGTWALGRSGGQRVIPGQKPKPVGWASGKERQAAGLTRASSVSSWVATPPLPTVTERQAVVWGEKGRHGERPGLGPPHGADRTHTHMPPERQEGGTHTQTHTLTANTWRDTHTHVNSKHSAACHPPSTGPTSLT